MPYVKNSEKFRKRSRRSQGLRRRLVLACAILAVAIAFTLALRPRSHAATPLANAHRKPALNIAAPRAPKWGIAARHELQRALGEALASATAGASSWSFVVLAADGTVLYDDRGSAAVMPASAQKLIVADAALTDLGPYFHYDTLLASTREPSNGVLNGDLWLAGSGDPSLRSSDLSSGMRVLRSNGLHAVEGDLVVDSSALAGQEINPHWNADDGNEDFMAATSGISIDENTAEFRITGGAAGEPARVDVGSSASAIRYYGEVESGGGDDVIVAATGVPNEFRLSGEIPSGVMERFWVPVHGIAQYAGKVTKAMMAQGGISVARPPRTGIVPVDAHILWEHRSQPLPALLQHMLVFSDNHFAEQLMRTIGGLNGSTANDADGIAAETRVLREQDIPTPGLHLVDGSGLAHADRVAGITLARLLAHFNENPVANPLYPLLPRGGLDGTLKMYDFTSAAGRVRAKSGHLSDAASLAGYVETRKHGRAVFAFLVNDSTGDPDSAIVAAVDRLAER